MMRSVHVLLHMCGGQRVDLWMVLSVYLYTCSRDQILISRLEASTFTHGDTYYCP